VFVYRLYGTIVLYRRTDLLKLGLEPLDRVLLGHAVLHAHAGVDAAAARHAVAGALQAHVEVHAWCGGVGAGVVWWCGWVVEPSAWVRVGLGGNGGFVVRVWFVWRKGKVCIDCFGMSQGPAAWQAPAQGAAPPLRASHLVSLSHRAHTNSHWRIDANCNQFNTMLFSCVVCLVCTLLSTDTRYQQLQAQQQLLLHPIYDPTAPPPPTTPPPLTVDTRGGIVLDAQVNVLADAKPWGW